MFFFGAVHIQNIHNKGCQGIAIIKDKVVCIRKVTTPADSMWSECVVAGNRFGSV